MVNVYWGEEFLPDMLDTFDKYEVKTTFFVGGSWVVKVLYVSYYLLTPKMLFVGIP